MRMGKGASRALIQTKPPISSAAGEDFSSSVGKCMQPMSVVTTPRANSVESPEECGE